MKAMSKVRLIFGSISMSVVLTAGFLGLATPAIAPSKAEAKALVLRQYANATQLSDKDLVGLLQATGFKGQSLKYAWAIAKKESHGRPLAYNGNSRTGDNSFGLFQVNMLGSMGENRRSQFGLSSNAELLNPVVNAQVAYDMSKGGKDWSAWKGTHQAIVQEWLTKYPYKCGAASPVCCRPGWRTTRTTELPRGSCSRRLRTRPRCSGARTCRSSSNTRPAT